MTELATMRDRLKEQIAAHTTLLASHTALLDAVEAEIARVPTVADAQAILARVVAGS